MSLLNKNNIKTIHKVNHLKIYLLGRDRWSEVGMGRDRRVPYYRHSDNGMARETKIQSL